MENSMFDLVTGYWFTTIFLFIILFATITPIVLTCLCGIRFFFTERYIKKDVENDRHCETQEDIFSISDNNLKNTKVFENDVRILHVFK